MTLAESDVRPGHDPTAVDATLVPFTAQTRMSGVDYDGRSIRKGATDAVKRWVLESGGTVPEALDTIAHGISGDGGTPLGVAELDHRDWRVSGARA